MFFKYFKRFVLALIGFFFLLTLIIIVFRKPIERFAVQQLDQYFKVPVYIHDVEFTFWKTFPHFSLRLDGVLIHDYSEVTGTLPDTLLYAKTIDLKANTWSLFRADMSIESIEVDDANIGFRIDDSGKDNFDIFVKDTMNTSGNFELNLKNLTFSNSHFSYANAGTEQFVELNIENLHLSGRFKNDDYELAVHSVFDIDKFKDKSINLLKGVQVDLTTELSVKSVDEIYEVFESDLLINKMPFQLSFLLNKGFLDFELKGSKIALEEVMKSIHQKNLEIVEGIEAKGLADFTLKVEGDIGKSALPNIDAQFKISKGSLTDLNTKSEIRKIELEGKYQKHNDKPETLVLNQLQLQTMGQSFNGSMSVRDFSKPEIKIAGQGGLDLASLHYFFPLPNVNQISGSLQIDGILQATVHNPGLPSQHIAVTNSKASFLCKKIAVKFNLDIPAFLNIDGAIATNNDDMVLNDFTIQTHSSKIGLSGQIFNIIDFLELKDVLNVDGTVQAERLNIDEFLKSSSSESATDSYGVGEFVLPKNINGQLIFEIKNLFISGHNFKDIVGSSQFSERQIDIKGLKFSHLGTRAQSVLRISETRAGTLELIGDATATNIDLKNLFSEWNNFDQENIKAENIRGKADLVIKFVFPFNMNSGLVKERMNAQVQLKVVDGALINVPSMKEIALSMRTNSVTRLFLGKDLASIEKKLANLTFETLENTFYIANSKFVIPRMLIKSNVLDLTVYGWQHFDESLEYHFEFDFRDLKERPLDDEFGRVVDDGFGTRLFLKMFGTLTNLQFVWDSDARKEHEKEERQQEILDIKGVLKTEFGLFKNDTTVRTRQGSSRAQEIIEIDFEEDVDPIDPETKNRQINEKYKRIKKKNSTNAQEVIIEFE